MAPQGPQGDNRSTVKGSGTTHISSARAEFIKESSSVLAHQDYLLKGISSGKETKEAQRALKALPPEQRQF